MGEVEVRRAETLWERLWAAIRPVELTTAVAMRAGQPAGRHALRCADAVHLASVLALGGDGTIFAVWDQRLRDGARGEQVRLAPA